MTDMGAKHSGWRELTKEEIELWRSVTANIQPRHRTTLVHVAPKKAVATPLHRERVPNAPHDRHHLAPRSIDPTVKRQLKKGRLEIEARLDLHWCRLAEAHARVTSFLVRAHANGARVVLIVTGKGKRAPDEDAGPLKRQTPMWLSDPRLRHLVAAFGEADPVHGGGGALYVRLRRKGRQ